MVATRRAPRGRSGSREPARTRSVERAADILLLFASDSIELGVTEIARRVGLGKGTVHRLLQSLVSRGLVTYVPTTQTYRLGGRILQLGMVVQQHLPIRTDARPTLIQLRDLTEETATLYLPLGKHQIAVEESVTHLNPKRIPSLGDPRPLHTGASGKVLLAFHSDAFIDDYLAAVPLRAYTAKTITDPVRFREELMKVRAQGYAVSIEELRPGTNGLAFPLLNTHEELLGAVAIAGPSNRWTPERIMEMLPACREVLRPLELRLSYMQPVVL